MAAASVGIDRYRRGWVAVATTTAAAPVVATARTLVALVSRFPSAACIGIDMPIGLPATERDADRAARGYVGRRWPSVFMTPPREVLLATSYEAANEVAAHILGGNKISKQAWALRNTIFEVAALAAEDERIIEVHPEVSFRTMIGHEVQYPKASWNGQSIRRAALEQEGIVFPDLLDAGGEVPSVDVLDAAAAAWSASRFALHRAASLPASAVRGDREVIWH